MKAFLLLAFTLMCFYGKASVLVVTIGATDASCGLSNGTISAYVQGGTPPYTYLWSTGDVLSALTGLPAGTYTLTVTDNVGAQASATTTVANIQSLQQASFTYIIPGQTPGGQQQVTLPCHSQCNGIAYLAQNVIVGTPPYFINIVNTTSTNPNLTTAIVSGVPAIVNTCTQDFYTVEVSDMTGCSATVYLSPPATNPSFNYLEQIKGACFGLNNGSVTLNFTNLYTQDLNIHYTGPVSDSISAFVGNGITISDLLPGTYSFNIAYPQIVSCDTTFTLVIPDLGTNCGVLSGSVILDTLSNCVLDVGEPLVPGQMIRFDPGPFFAFSDSAGNFEAQLPYANYTATLLSSAPLFPVCSQTNLNLSAANDTITNVVLGDSVNTDLNLVTGITNGFFRPGFSGAVYVNVKNTAYALVPYPQLDLYFDSTLTYISSALPPIINAPGHLRFMLNLLNGFQETILPVFFQVPPDPALIGTTLTFNAVASANLPENDLSDNSDSAQVIVTGSFDPNDKAVAPSRDSLNSFYTNLDTEIHYRIRFQNTGNDTAFTVVVVDTLSAALTPASFRLLASSHPVKIEMQGGNVLRFIFNNILLPDSNTNEAQSHGVISFSIEPFTPVTAATIDNKAEIYFDFNPPVITNVVSSFITVSTGMGEVKKGNELKLVPNPVSGILKVQLMTSDFHPETVVINNVLGQTCIRTEAAFYSGIAHLDVSSLPDGVYFLNVYNDRGESISSRLVVQH